jgi:hypothetical protein
VLIQVFSGRAGVERWHAVLHPVQLHLVERHMQIVPRACQAPYHVPRDAILHSFDEFSEILGDGLIVLVILNDLDVVCNVLLDELSAEFLCLININLVFLHKNPDGIHNMTISSALCCISLSGPRV